MKPVGQFLSGLSDFVNKHRILKKSLATLLWVAAHRLTTPELVAVLRVEYTESFPRSKSHFIQYNLFVLIFKIIRRWRTSVGWSAELVNVSLRVRWQYKVYYVVVFLRQTLNASFTKIAFQK